MSSSSHRPRRLFREYIGAMYNGVKFTDVPIDKGVDFHFILSFAIDYTEDDKSPAPTNGKFNLFWDNKILSPRAVAAIKERHGNVKVALSLGGDTVSADKAYFRPKSIDSWVRNAVESLTKIFGEYHLDGIDINYEHFKADPNTFAECIGKLLATLKGNGVVSFASIAPFNNVEVQKQYQALWKKYHHLIDYVNFQFYADDSSTTVPQFHGHFEEQTSNYSGGKVLVGLTSNGGGGLSPANGFFGACATLKKDGKLVGMFMWSADDSKRDGFRYEKQSQSLLAT